jgi:hypothetical protein
MIDERIQKQILEVWGSHVSTFKKDLGDEGQAFNSIDESRTQAIEVVKIIIHNFIKGDFDINDFKTALDSYNKHNNLWGFTAKLGQMYFNQIIKSNEKSLTKLTALFKDVIQEPKNIRDALSKIDALEKFTTAIYKKAKDKHNAPYPGAVGFFLSYFWQIRNHQKWPIMYNTLVNSFRELGVWEEQETQKELYNQYYSVYNEVKKLIETETGKKITYWDIEHAFWNYKYKAPAEPVKVKVAADKIASPVEEKLIEEVTEEQREVAAEDHAIGQEMEAPVSPAQTQEQNTSEAIDIREYLMPRLSRLLDQTTLQDQAKPATQYQTLVAEAFSQLEFEIEVLDQSIEKNAYAILRFPDEQVAFILDAEPKHEDFFRNTDRRIVKDYVHVNCRTLNREGYQKVGYMVISDSFDKKHQAFVSYINWNTDIKKTSLISTEALLYLLAYKLKHRLNLMHIIDRIAAFPYRVYQENISEILGE